MPSAITDLLTKASSGTRPSPTTLNAPKAIGAGSISCAALTGWNSTTAVHFAIYNIDANNNKIAGTQTDWKGLVSGASITNLVLKAGTDNGYAIGAVVECTPTAAWADDMYTWGSAQHDVLGAHTAVTAASVAATGDTSDNSTTHRVVRDETLADHVTSGGVWSGDSYGSTRAASMTALVCYIDGYRLSVGAVTARSFTASKDTYVDVLRTGLVGSLVYTEVANNAASPALAANSIRLGIIVTGVGSIASAGSVNQGEETKILPIASSVAYAVTDSLGNLICNRTPNPTLIGYRQTLGTFTTASATAVQITGLSCPVIVPTGRKVKVTLVSSAIYNTTGVATSQADIYAGVVGGTRIQTSQFVAAGANYTAPLNAEAIYTPSTSSITFNGALFATSGTAGFQAASGLPGYIKVELV
jgi:hypothetical protein